MICANCNAVMTWQNDFNYEDYGIMDKQGIVTVYHCGDCGTLSENYIPVGEEE